MLHNNYNTEVKGFLFLGTNYAETQLKIPETII